MPRIARHSEKGDDHSHRCFCFMLILVSFLGLFVIPNAYHKGKKKICQAIYYVGQGPQTTFPVWVLPSAATSGSHYFGNTRVLLGCYPTQNGFSSQRTISWGQWDERACTWTSWSANIVETKTAVPLQVSHIYRSLFEIMAQKAPKCSSCFYMQYLQSFKITILGHTYRASNCVTYRASKS